MPGTGCSNLKSGWTRPLWAGARGVHPKEILGVTKLPDDAEVVPTVTGAQSDLTRAVLGGGRREKAARRRGLRPVPNQG
jgi:hypothetical protein